MSGLDELAPDQRAVLQLLLKQGKSYDDIAGLLRLDRASVRTRALDALDALGADDPAARELAEDDQDGLTDHLLGQQPEADRPATERLLATSAPARAWARTVGGALTPIAGDALPAIPDEGAGGTAHPPASVAEAREVRGPAARDGAPRSSKLGGVVVLVAVGAVLAVGLILLLRGGGDSSSADTGGATATQTGTTGAAVLPDQQINLAAGKPSTSKALGFAIVQQGALALQAQGLPRSDTYAVWLWNSASDALPLGLARYDTKTKRVAGTLQSMPAESVKYANLVITRQKSKDTTTPGPVVLGGALKRG